MTDALVALVPVKPPEQGKSRLLGVPDAARGRLAAAFAHDTVRACLAADRLSQVLVVTDDESFAHRVAALGAQSCTDGEERGLNAALRHGAAVAAERWPGSRMVALCADLPALRPSEISEAVVALPAGPAYVTDAEGTGTTLFSAPYDAFEPRFGDSSANAHKSAGALALPGDWPGLRRDVDDLSDLRAAVRLGIGPATAAVLADLPPVGETRL